MKSITKTIVELAISNILLEEKDFARSLTKSINMDDFQKIIREVREQGPMMENLIKRKFAGL
jgi:hypothetical protein